MGPGRRRPRTGRTLGLNSDRLPEGTLGRGVFKLYQSRGFVFPGSPGISTTVARTARLGPCARRLRHHGRIGAGGLRLHRPGQRRHAGFSLLAMVISLFETGYLRTGAGLFEASPVTSRRTTASPLRIADAMRRGALCRDSVLGIDSIDYLHLDWFTIADLSVTDARRDSE